MQAKFITSNDKIAALNSFMKENNPNIKNKEIPADLLSVAENSGSKEYVDWVKKQTLMQENEAPSGLDAF